MPAPQRELLEETGIAAEPVRDPHRLDFIRRDDAGGMSDAHFTLIAVLLEWRAGEGEPIEDATRARLVHAGRGQGAGIGAFFACRVFDAPGIRVRPLADARSLAGHDVN